jgi:hypothetical protein
MRGKIADRLPTFGEGGAVPKYTAAHFHAALYVQAAVRGFLARYQMRNKLANSEMEEYDAVGSEDDDVRDDDVVDATGSEGRVVPDDRQSH